MSRRVWLVIIGLVSTIAIATRVGIYLHRPTDSISKASLAAAGNQPVARGAQPLIADFQEVLASQRKIIVLMADEKTLSEAQRRSANAVGQVIYHENLDRVAHLQEALRSEIEAGKSIGFTTIEQVLDYVESDPRLFDADRLAFKDLLSSMQTEIGSVGSLPAVKLHKRIGEDLDGLSEIEKNYEAEITQIFSRFESRALTLKRERWDDYVEHLRGIYNREKILKDYAVVTPYSPEQLAVLDKSEHEKEFFGNSLAPKTLVLTFDDGPHPRYTEEIEAILQQYGVPAVFFQVGRNLGTVDGTQAKLGASSKVARKLMADGFVIGNHSYSHAQLSKISGDNLKSEIESTDALLRAVDEKRSPLFRFPYGAHNSEAMQMLESDKLRSVMWNIDSLDWADPVPSSIADRVLRTVDAEGRGIILFHDIHERTIRALPLVLDRLIADGYQFADWDGVDFSLRKNTATPAANATVTTGYNQSWAVIIGIDEYAKYPHLQYAVHDAEAIRQTLVQKFGFAQERVVMLENGEATRNGILTVFHDKLDHSDMQKNDRVFVFFAGHGATRTLTSGRQLGYIVPVDADPEKLASDSIAMTEIQNIAESLPAKHVLFVMDSCYSGLGLTRGAGNTYLRENAKRIGRQMLTAGGADQLVADGGPNGHSVFSWALLQALAGKADLNNDGYITATELAAYMAPAVAGVSQQTPAFGSLPGSQGGEFVFELPAEAEFLSADSTQLSSEGIALNTKLDAAAPSQPVTAAASTVTPSAPVTVPDLQGTERKLSLSPTIGSSPRQLAQRANDHGLQLYREKSYAEAENAFTEALRLRPDFALAANNLGYVFFKQNKYAEAARWFEKALQLDPSRAVAYLNLGDAQAQSGSENKAAQAFRTYIELAPNGAGVAHAKEMLGKLQ